MRARAADWWWWRDAKFREERGQSKIPGCKLLGQFGVYRAESIGEFSDLARRSVIGTLLAYDQVAMATVSGEFSLLPMPEAEQRRLSELVPFVPACNTIDDPGQFLNGPSLLDQAIEVAATNGDYKSLVSFQGSIARGADGVGLRFLVGAKTRPPRRALCRAFESLDNNSFVIRLHGTIVASTRCCAQTLTVLDPPNGLYTDSPLRLQSVNRNPESGSRSQPRSPSTDGPNKRAQTATKFFRGHPNSLKFNHKLHSLVSDR